MRHERLKNWRRLKMRIVLAAGIFVAFAVLVAGSVCTTQPGENAVVPRFGRLARTVGPRLHFKIPLCVERVLKVAAGRVMQREYGHRMGRTSAQSGPTGKGLEAEARMLTGDLNVIDLK